jgi:flavorubredoxin
VVELVKPKKVFVSKMGEKALSRHFRTPMDFTVVQDGETVRLGNTTLRFFETRMLHWPDSMFTYLPEQGLLFSQDGFGMHLGSGERFADEIPDPVLEREAAKYYANILLPFSPQVKKLFEKVEKVGLQPKIVAPDHGPIWRRDVGRILGWYARWAEQKPRKKAVVVFDTMWQSTGIMARAVSEGLAAGGLGVNVMPLGSNHRSDVATEILDAGALVVGSPTLNNGLFPTMADVLTYLKGLRPRNLTGAAFGSYGWSGEAVRLLNESLRAMKVEPVSEGVKAAYVPDGDVLDRCFRLGEQVAAKVQEMCGASS